MEEEYAYTIRRDILITKLKSLLIENPTKEDEFINAGILRSIDTVKCCPIEGWTRKETK